MKRLTVRSCGIAATSALVLATALRLSAQTTAPAAGSTEDSDTTVVLSPFVVEANEDAGYFAKDTLAGTRVRTELKDVGSAIQVVTQKFLQDTGSKNAADLLVYTTGTEVAGQGGNFAGAGDGAVIDTTAYTQPVANTRVRGLAQADNLRDFFLTDIPWDSYNVGRVDLQRGANSVLFGIGSPAGIINSSLNGAAFKDDNRINIQFSAYGSNRQSADFNKVLIKNTLAIRVAALRDDTSYKQKPAFREDKRIYAALRWDPKLFSDTTRTSIRANYEKGEIDANYPRLTPPMDSITPWFSSMSKGTFLYQDSNNLTTYGNPAYNPWLGAAGNRIWDGLASTFNYNNATQTGIIAANVQNFPAPPDSSYNNTVNGSYKGVQAFNSYAANARMTGYVIQPFKAKSLTDASIFDFYNNLIEGNNKSNSNEFDAFNISASQTYLNDKLGFEVAYDKQDSSWGYKNAISGDAAAISIDVMSTLADGSANPNVGRAMVIAGGGSAGAGATNRIRETLRATAFGKVDFGDIFQKNSSLAKILGVHNITLAYTDYTDETFSKNWVNWYVGAGYGPVANIAVGQAGRDLTPIIYLSDDLRSRAAATGLALPRVTANIVAQGGTVRQYDTTTMSFINYNVPVVTPNEANGPYTQASKDKNEIKSQVFVWQGQLFGGNLVPMFGWRKDKAISYNAGSPGKTLGLVTNINDPTWRLPTGASDATTANGRSYNLVEGITRTYSLVLHAPKSVMSKLPGQMGASVFYNKSENFQPDASRKDILGFPIEAPKGETEDYGFTISMLDSKLFLKVNRYETKVTNATLNGGGLGNVYLIGAGEAWGQAAAYQLSVNSGNWPGDGNYGTTTAGSAFGAGHILRWQPAGGGPYTDAEINAQYDAQRRSTDDWMAHQLPVAFQQAWGMSGYATGSGSWSQNTVAVTGDTLSKGTEFELIASNLFAKGLDISINASKTDARRLNIAKAYSDWIEKRWVDYQGPMGDMRLWGNGNWALTEGAGGTVRDKFNNEVMPNYRLALALNGSNVPELRPWRFNFVTNYTFQDGSFKGANVGASYRWQDEQVVGYRLNTTNTGYDVTKPYFGPTESAIDLWVGYERKITSRIKWRIQLNVRDVFASKKLIPLTVQPDGSPGAYRIPEPRTWSIENSFMF